MLNRIEKEKIELSLVVVLVSMALLFTSISASTDGSVDPRAMGSLLSSDETYVVVELKDNSSVDDVLSKLTIEPESFLGKFGHGIMSTLGLAEKVNIKKVSVDYGVNSFSGDITKEGYEILSRDPNVKGITISANDLNLTVNLNLPLNATNNIILKNATFNCTAALNGTGPENIKNITLFTNFKDVFTENGTNYVSARNVSTLFNRNFYPTNMSFFDAGFVWNCLSYSTEDESAHATHNYSLSSWGLGIFNYSEIRNGLLSISSDQIDHHVYNGTFISQIFDSGSQATNWTNISWNRAITNQNWDYSCTFNITEDDGYDRRNEPVVMTGAEINTICPTIYNAKENSLRIYDINFTRRIIQIDDWNSNNYFVNDAGDLFDSNDEVVFFVNLSAYQEKQFYLYYDDVYDVNVNYDTRFVVQNSSSTIRVYDDTKDIREDLSTAGRYQIYSIYSKTMSRELIGLAGPPQYPHYVSILIISDLFGGDPFSHYYDYNYAPSCNIMSSKGPLRLKYHCEHNHGPRTWDITNTIYLNNDYIKRKVVFNNWDLNKVDTYAMQLYLSQSGVMEEDQGDSGTVFLDTDDFVLGYWSTTWVGVTNLENSNLLRTYSDSEDVINSFGNDFSILWADNPNNLKVIGRKLKNPPQLDYLYESTNLKRDTVYFQARSCHFPDCRDANFTGHDTFLDSYYTNSTNQGLNVSLNRYFQYKAYIDLVDFFIPYVRSVTILYEDNNHVPTLVASVINVTFPEDTISSSLDLSTYFTDLDSDDINWTATSVENITVTINNNTGIVTFTPDNNFTGIRYVTFVAYDIYETNTTSNLVTLNVTPVNDGPYLSLTISNVTWLEDTTDNSLDISLFFVDIDGDDLNWTAHYVENITININNNTGVVSLVPQGNFTGDRNVTFTAFDPSGAYAISNNITLNVTPVNDPPYLRTPIINLSWSEDTNYTGLNLDDYFYDIDGDILSYDVYLGYSWPTNIVPIIGGNLVNLTPYPNFNGLDNITFRASDGLVFALSDNVSLNVTPGNDPPTPVDLLLPLNNYYSDNPYQIFNWTNSTDIDGDQTITYHLQIAANVGGVLNFSTLYGNTNYSTLNTSLQLPVELVHTYKNYSWRVLSCDDSFSSNSCSVSSEERILVVDYVPPVVDILSPIIYSTVAGYVNISYSILGGDINLSAKLTDERTWVTAGWYNIINSSGDNVVNGLLNPFSGDIWQNIWLDTSQYSDGNYTLVINATDKPYEIDQTERHYSSENVSFVLDNTAPNITILYPNESYYNTNFIMDLFAIDLHMNTSYINITSNGSLINIPLSGNMTLNYSLINSSGTYNFSKINQGGYLVWDVIDTFSPIHNFTMLFDITNITDGNYSLSIFSGDVVGNSNSSETWFVIDTIPPNITIFSPVESKVYTGFVNITTNITDFGVGVENSWYEIINISSGSQIINGSLNLTDNWSAFWNASDVYDLIGNFTLIVHATDKLSMESSENVTFIIDNSPPEVELISPIDNYYSTSLSVDLICNVSDNINLDFVVLWGNFSGGWASVDIEYVSGTSNLTVFSQNLDDGTYAWNCLVSDEIGYQAFAQFNYTLTIDTTFPKITVQSPLDDEVVGWTVGLETNVTEDGGAIDSTWYEIINSTNTVVDTGILTSGGNWDSTWVTSDVTYPDGNYTFKVSSNDTLGNLGSVNVTFTLDNTRSDIVFFNPNMSMHTNNFDLKIILDEPHITKSWVNITNETGDSVYLEVNLSIINLTELWTDISWVNYSWFSHINHSNWSDGNYSLTVYVEDIVGNNITDSTWFFLDKVPPQITLVYPDQTRDNSQTTVDFNCSATDNFGLYYGTLYTDTEAWWHSEIPVYVNGTSNSAAWQLTNVIDGTYFWNCVFYDLAGNSVYGSQNQSFIVDTFALPPPTAPKGKKQLIAIPDIVKDGDTVIFLYREAEIGLDVTIDSSEIGELDDVSPYTITLNDNGSYPDLIYSNGYYTGLYTINESNGILDGNKSITATLDSGASTTYVNVTVILDNEDPFAEVLINNGEIYANSKFVTLSLNYSDVNGVSNCRYNTNLTRLNTTAWEVCLSTKSWVLDNGQGVKTVYYEVRDNAGNTRVVNDTIIQTAEAKINSIECFNGTSWRDCDNLSYNYYLSHIRVNCTDVGSNISNVFFRLRNNDDRNNLFDSPATYYNSDIWYYEHKNYIKDSGIFNLTVRCIDYAGADDIEIIDWSVPFGLLNISSLETQVNASRGLAFNLSVTVECKDKECGDIELYVPVNDSFYDSRISTKDDFTCLEMHGGEICESSVEINVSLPRGNSFNVYVTANSTNYYSDVNHVISETINVTVVNGAPTKPVILTPNGRESLDDLYNVNWTESIDLDLDPVTYELDYSIDSGINWVNINDSINSTYYSWDTNSVSNSETVVIRLRASDGVLFTDYDYSDSNFMIDHVKKDMIILQPHDDDYISGLYEIKVIAPFESGKVTFEVSDGFNSTGLGGVTGVTTDDVSGNGWYNIWNTTAFNDGNYTLTVRAYDKLFILFDRMIAEKIIYNVNIDNKIPDAPNNLTAMDELDGDGIITLNWRVPSDNDIASYNIYRSITPDFDLVTGNFVKTVSNNTAIEILPEGTYYYRVTAVDYSGHESTPTNELEVQVVSIPFGRLSTIPVFVKNGDYVTFMFKTNKIGLDVSLNQTELNKFDSAANYTYNFVDELSGIYRLFYHISETNNVTDGVKEVYATVDNGATRIGTHVSLFLDNTPPNATVTIFDAKHGYDAYASTLAVNLELEYEDFSGVEECRYSNYLFSEDFSYEELFENTSSLTMTNIDTSNDEIKLASSLSNGSIESGIVLNTNDSLSGILLTAEEYLPKESATLSMIEKGFISENSTNITFDEEQQQFRRIDIPINSDITSATFNITGYGISGIEIMIPTINENIIFSYDGYLNSTVTVPDFSDVLNEYLSTCRYIDDECRIGMSIKSSSEGVLQISGVDVGYMKPAAEIRYYVSLDDGLNYEQVKSGTEHSFDTVGDTVRWKAELITYDTSVTPVLYNLSIEDTYQTDWEECVLTKPWELSPDGQEVRRVYYQLRDRAGNIRTANGTILYRPETPEEMIDVSPPVNLTVIDDRDYSNDYQTLYGKWTAYDPQTFVYYRVQICEDMNCQFFPGAGEWYYMGRDNDNYFTGLEMREGYNYSLKVVAENGDNIPAKPVYSDGVIIDLTGPDYVNLSSTHNSSIWYTRNDVEFNFTGTDVVSEGVSSGVKGFSYRLDRLNSTIPDNLVDEEIDNYVFDKLNSVTDGVSLKYNSTGLARAVVVEVKTNLTTGDIINVKTRLMESNYDSYDMMNYSIFIVDDMPQTYDTIGTAVSDVVISSLELTNPDSVSDMGEYSNDLLILSDIDDGDFYVIVKGDENQDDLNNDLLIGTNDVSYNSSVANYYCEETALSCVNTTNVIDYAVGVTLLDIRNDSLWDKSYDNLRDGSYYFHIKAIDHAGNGGNLTHYRVNVDTTPPPPPVMYLYEIHANQSDTAFNWSPSVDISGIVGYYLEIDNNISFDSPISVPGVGFINTTSSIVILPSTGTYYARVRAVNGVGLNSTWSSLSTVLSDITPPEILFKKPDGAIVSRSPIFVVITDEDATCEYNNGGFQTFSYTGTTYHEVKVSVSAGNYDIRCTDPAGNSVLGTISVSSVSTGYSISSVTITDIPELIFTGHPIVVNITVNPAYGEIDVDNFKFEIDGTDYDFSIVDLGRGKYAISFFAPEFAKTYDIKSVVDGIKSDVRNIDVNNLILVMEYMPGVSISRSNSKKTLYTIGDNYTVGFASQSDYTKVSGSDSSKLQFESGAVNVPSYIFMTSPYADPDSRDTLLSRRDFENVINPSFGYIIDKDVYALDMFLEYDNINVSGNEVLSKGLYHLKVKNKGKKGNKVLLTFELKEK